VQRRLEAAAKGETVEFLGQPVDPRYRFKNSTLIDWLSISSKEMTQLRTIVSPDERRNRDRARKEAERRSAGRLLRTDYEKAAQQKAEIARALRDQGHSLGEIAQRLGISRASAHGYCRSVG
ncbi:MAG: helix-turn-helix domain-containing protein, partial [Burkholderiales bacterium]